MLCTGLFALFGHSIGARMAFETSQKLTASACVNLLGLHLSGTAAPGFSRRRGPFHQDLDTRPFELESWRTLAGRPFRMRLYEGGHFYLFQNALFLPELALDLAHAF